MTFRKFRRRARKAFQSKIKRFEFNLYKKFYFKKEVAYWKNFSPNSTSGYPLIKEVWELTCSKTRFISKIRYRDLYLFYFECLHYYLHFQHKNYANKITKIDAIKEHDKFIVYLYDQEKKRQENIDNKAKQLITNTSIILTIIGLVLTLLINFFKVEDKVIIGNWDFYLLILAITSLFISLIISIHVLNFKKYARPFPEVIFKLEYSNEETFLRRKVQSFHFPILLNTMTNSVKSNRLVFATYTYIVSLILVSLLILKKMYYILV